MKSPQSTQLGSARAMLEAFEQAGGRTNLGRAALTDALHQAHRAGQQAWPTVGVDAEVFAVWLAKRWHEGDVRAHAADGYLACACEQGNEAAQVALATVVAGLDGLSRFSEKVQPEDVRQELLQRLLVDRGRGRKIVGYAGAAPLRAWLRAAAVRTAIRLARAGRREVASPHVLEREAGNTSPEAAVVNRRQQRQFETAFQAALVGLPARARRLLRAHYVEGRSLDALSVVNQVHRATVVRWLAAARADVLNGTLHQLVEQFGLSPGEAEAVIEGLTGQLHATLSGALKSTNEVGSLD